MTDTKNVRLNAKIEVTEGIAVTVLIETNPSLNRRELSFVNLKSELTAAKEVAEAKGLDVYRCRLQCNCKPTSMSGKTGLNRRNGILIANSTGQIIERVICCKSCMKGGQQ